MTDSTITSPGYRDFVESRKTRVRAARVRAALSVNRELVLLYWDIGRDILARQAEVGWGAKVVDQISRDLRRAFPDMKGFSPRNLKYMRAFAEAWPDAEFVQQAVAQIPSGHIVRILDKADSPDERLFYVQKTVEAGWSRNVLVAQIDSKLHERQGKAVTNFSQTLAPATRTWSSRRSRTPTYSTSSAWRSPPKNARSSGP